MLLNVIGAVVLIVPLQMSQPFIQALLHHQFIRLIVLCLVHLYLNICDILNYL